MTDRIEEIRERLEAADTDQIDFTFNYLGVTWPGEYNVNVGMAFQVGYDGEEGLYTNNPANADLIAHAPEDIRYLLEKVEELENADG